MTNLTDEKLDFILRFYNLPGKFLGCSGFGNGNINSTFLIKYEDEGREKKYVLQKINKYVFHHPDELMENMIAVTGHLRKKVAARGGDTAREVMTVVSAANGDTFCLDDQGEYWRITAFIEDAVSYDIPRCPEDFYETGLAFGKFQSELSDFPAETLYYTIPGFHDTRARYERFKQVVAEDKAGRVKECKEEIDFILCREELARYSMDSYDRHEIPLRVTHNDTKLNNLMMDKETGKAICVLDLDTVMPGFVMMDFGDAIRTGACTAMEDEPDLSKVNLDLNLYECFARGFIEGCKDKLTPHEIDTLPMGALGITYEQAMRFLTDYLEGDIYYRTDYPQHNIVRTHTQMKMVEELEANKDKIQAIIEKYK